ncbi:MAG TPA: peptidoglycan editing factor PgeF, partial [Syntrophomonadaceae bacterium]|nr:peptidoglycan editing factor PgeF [Syntrophomonadaceae bacterium]
MLEWIWTEKNGISFITVPEWAQQGIDVAFTGRWGGTSTGSFNSLNMGLHVGDSKDLVLENRRRLMKVFNHDINDMVCCQQVHGNQVVRVTARDKGCGSSDLGSCVAGADGMVTNQSGLYMAAFYADCIPVFLFDPIKRCIGIVHSGWKGTMGRIPAYAITVLNQEFGSSRTDIQAFIGPGIGPCCFEVQYDLALKANSEFGQFHDIISKDKNDCYKWDLPLTIYNILICSGLKSDNIAMAKLCT